MAKVHASVAERVPDSTSSARAHGVGGSAAVTAGAPDLLLLDLYLPDVSGLECCAG